MSDVLVRIKRAILAGRYVFSEKARLEMEADGLTELDVSGRGGTVKLQDGTVIARVKPYETVTLSLDPKAPGRGVRRVNHVEEDIAGM